MDEAGTIAHTVGGVEAPECGAIPAVRITSDIAAPPNGGVFFLALGCGFEAAAWPSVFLACVPFGLSRAASLEQDGLGSTWRAPLLRPE